MDKILDLLNIAPGWKTKASAVAAFGLAIVAAWNTMVPELGFGPCTLADAAACGVDLTVKVPEIINAAVLALLGVGAANQPKNIAAKTS